LASLLALPACDTVTAVNRSARLDAIPALDCVQAAIAATPGVAEVRRGKSRTGRELTTTGLHSQGTVDYFIYRGAEGSNIRGVVQIEPEGRRSVHFSQHLVRVNAEIPPAEIEASRPVMRRIEQELAQRCGLAQVAAVREQCLGADCPPLD
jgi:hypothetical protein